MSVVPLAARQLADKYDELITDGTFGPPAQLYALQRIAFDLARQSTGDLQLVAYLVSSVLRDLAAWQERELDPDTVRPEVNGLCFAFLKTPMHAAVATLRDWHEAPQGCLGVCGNLTGAYIALRVELDGLA